MKKPRSRPPHSHRESVSLGERGVAEVKELLHSETFQENWHRTHSVGEFQNNPDHFKTDDLTWAHFTEGGLEFYRIEVKCDRNANSGNFLFETISDVDSKSPGCFMASESDWLFYYFITIKKLYALPMHATREWLEKHCEEFETRTTRNERDGRTWQIEGRLVRIGAVLQAIPEVKIFEKTQQGWETLRSDLAPDRNELNNSSLSRLFS